MRAPGSRNQQAGLDTVISSAQLALSAGYLSSKRRSELWHWRAMARAFLRDPAVVVLDEAAARLELACILGQGLRRFDPVTEREVERALAALLEGRTGVVIAAPPALGGKGG